MKTRKVDVLIKNDKTGEIVYKKDQFEIPSSWSDRAAQIVASKYSMNDEYSALGIIDRVVTQITSWGIEQGYFMEPLDAVGNEKSTDYYKFSQDLKEILINQKASFNSPVWFNVGSDTPTNQASACFILPVEDTMESILEHYKTEGLVFRAGSGAGINISKLRAKGETLSNKGTSTGPLSFCRGWDRSAGTIKSGGKVRRAAKLVCLDCDHPDVFEFVESKKKEEDKAKILMNNGVSSEEAYSTVDFQNSNISLRVTDDFMNSAIENKAWYLQNRGDRKRFKVSSKDLLRKTAEIAWECGDPGIMFSDRTNRDNPVPSKSVIWCHNPCIEFAAIDNSSCNLASINLVKYYDQPSNMFDWDDFKKTVDTLITAMDIIVEGADYPTEAIRETTVSTRPLGLGFSSLGALLVLKGLPYDSKEGRLVAKEITKRMTTYAYARSIELATKMGSFEAFEDNKSVNGSLAARLTQSEDIGNWVEEKGLRNSQLTLLAPTGCLTGDTLVLSSEGLLPIEELSFGDDEWQDINIKVPQENGLFESNKFYLNGKDQTLKVTTSKGHEIKCTKQHKFRVIDKNGDYIWKKAKDLEETDLMALRLGGHKEVLKDKEYIKLFHPTQDGTIILDEHFANVIGYYMGDGYLKKAGGVHFVINNEDSDLIDIFQRWADRTDTNITKEEKEGCFIAHNNSRQTYRWFNQLEFAKEKGNKGEGAASAFVPIHILSSRSSVLAAFLSGLFEADGTIYFKGKTKTPTIELSTVSKTLATQVMTAMESLGIPMVLKEQEPREDTKGNRLKYRVRVASLDGVYVFAYKIGFLSKRKQSKLNNWIKEQHVDNILIANPSRHLHIKSAALINDFYECSVGLSNETRQDISARKTQGKFNLKWAWDIINLNKELKNSKIQKILELSDLGNIQFVPFKSMKNNGSIETYDISVPENNTYIANSFLTHNTISFMMDCDTTGIEPLFALKSIKQLAGGGSMEIVPECVKQIKYKSLDEAIIEGGYTSSEILKTANEISWKAHIDMMAACQDHLNGCISKTVNMSAGATIEDVEQAYIYAWNSGLKALAIYRDGSKALQPLSDANKVEAAPIEVSQTIHEPLRIKPDQTHDSITHTVDLAGHRFRIIAGTYPDGSLCEIFVSMSKEGSTLSGIMNGLSRSVSLGLQYGVPLQAFVDQFIGMSFEPSGITRTEDIALAKSILDYIGRWLEKTFIIDLEKEEDEDYEELEDHIVDTVKVDQMKWDKEESTGTGVKLDGPPCTACGGLTYRQGTCYLCSVCGTTTGCS